MRRLIVQQWVTLDLVAAEPDGGLGFVTAQPFDDAVTDDPFQNATMRFIDSVGTMVLGATTYAQSKDYWPYAVDQGEYGRRLNSLDKIVASTTLQQAPWGDFPAAAVTADPVATIREAKTGEGKALWLWGSLSLMTSLLEAGLVDELRLLVCPTSRGAGRRLLTDRRDLTLLEATGFGSGVVLLRYALQP